VSICSKRNSYRKNHTAIGTGLADIGRRLVHGLEIPNVCDIIFTAPFESQRIGFRRSAVWPSPLTNDVIRHKSHNRSARKLGRLPQPGKHTGGA
jgi:hypothetical protein